MPDFKDYQIPRGIHRKVDLEGRSVILRRPISLQAVIPDMIRAEQQTGVVVAQSFDVMDFQFPDPRNFNTREVFSNGEMRGYRFRNGLFEPIVDDEADFVYFAGDVMADAIEAGRAMLVGRSFRILQTYIDERSFNIIKKTIIAEAKSGINDKPSSQRGNTRLS